MRNLNQRNPHWMAGSVYRSAPVALSKQKETCHVTLICPNGLRPLFLAQRQAKV